MKIGFIGLDIMGNPKSRNLVGALEIIQVLENGSAGGEDHSAIVKFYEQLADLELDREVTL